MRAFCSRVSTVFPNVIIGLKESTSLFSSPLVYILGVVYELSVMTVMVGRLNWGRVGWVGQWHINIFLGFVLIWIFIVMFYRHPWGLKFTFLIKIKHTQKKHFLLVLLSLDIKGLFKWVKIKLVESHEKNSRLFIFLVHEVSRVNFHIVEKLI